MKKNLLKVAFLVAIAILSGITLLNAQKSETLSEMTLAEFEAEAHTVGCKTSYGSPLYYCIDWSVVTLCICANVHTQHVNSYCPDRLCE